jgi:hypothetical protein
VIGNYWDIIYIPLFFAILWQNIAPFHHFVVKGAYPQNACILTILEIIGKWIRKQIPLFFAILWQNIFIK